jgi:hypothetical protein
MPDPRTLAQPGDSREQVHRRVNLFRRTAVAAAVLAFAGAWDLVAHHTVGITARAQTSPAPQYGGSPPAASSPSSGGFFGSGSNGGSGSAGIGGGNGNAPVLGSGGS